MQNIIKVFFVENFLRTKLTRRVPTAVPITHRKQKRKLKVL
jgi:hypothetical protein